MSSGPPTKRLKQVSLLSFSKPSTSQEPTATAVTDLSQQIDEPKVEASVQYVDMQEPFHPPADFKFKQDGERSCHANWFREWQWLHYDEDKDVVRCFTCISAVQKKLMPLQEKKSESAFTDYGFRNWKRGPEKFRIHERSEFHSKAAEKLLASRRKGIDAVLSQRVQLEQKVHRDGLEVIFSAIFFLGQQGFPLRGHDHDDGAFFNLVHEMARCKPDVLKWLQKRDNFLSDTIQNEIIELVSHEVQREIVQRASTSYFIGVTADGTTDGSGKEQFAVCLQYVDKSMSAHTSFLGFYNPPDSKGETLAATIVDVLTRLGIPLEKLSGFSFDTAANMSGVRQGVQARLKERCPGSIYVPCCNHSLDLCLQELARTVTIISDTLEFVRNVGTVIRESANRRELYASMFDSQHEVKHLHSLCPTRWCVRGGAVKRALDSFEEIRRTLAHLAGDKNVRVNSQALIRGLSNQAGKMATYIGLYVSSEIFLHCDATARVLQQENITASESMSAVNLLKQTLQRVRQSVPELVAAATATAKQLELKPPAEKRRTKTPARLRHDEEPEAREDEKQTFETELHASFNRGLDLMLNKLDERFANEGVSMAIAREQLIMKSATDSTYVDSVLFESLGLPPSFECEKLTVQLKQLKDFMEASDDFEGNTATLSGIAQLLASQDRITQVLFSELFRLASMCLSQPCSNASSERAFSSLRRLKTWLRNTMAQSRLTHLGLMATSQDILRRLDRNKLMQEFVSRTSERRSAFGSFSF